MKNHLIYIVIILVLIFLLFKGCNDRAYENKSEESVKEYLNDTISYYQNKVGQEVAKRKAINGSKESLEVLLTKQIDSTQQLKRLVDHFKKVDAAGNITQRFEIDSSFVPYNTLSFVIGKQKGLFNNDYSIQAVNSNPNIKTIGLDSYTFKAKPKRFGLGLHVGYGINSELNLAPYVGIGVSYNLFSF